MSEVSYMNIFLFYVCLFLLNFIHFGFDIILLYLHSSGLFILHLNFK